MPASGKHVRLVGSTLLPINLRFEDDDGPLNLASYTLKIRVEDEGGTVIVNNSATGVTAHPTQTFTGASTGLATCVKHGVKTDDQVIVANSGGALPTGLAASTRYFAVDVTPNAFGLASVPGGASVITAAGTGTNTFYIVGSAQYAPPVGVTGTVQNARLWGVLESGSDIHYIPNDELGMAIEIKAVGN